ncbi:hypothetical protein AP071_07045 [Rhodobacter capsulatus]|nr:hypothetical protein AP071_07045 [Rhodobacter capsulatus]KQB16690.1 hypothetical protein AP073_10370 [Rhodobacter capsulatus]
MRIRVASLEAQMERIIGDSADRRAEQEVEFHDWLDEQRSTVIKFLILTLEEAVPSFNAETLRARLVQMLVEPWSPPVGCSDAAKTLILFRRARCEELISECLP